MRIECSHIYHEMIVKHEQRVKRVYIIKMEKFIFIKNQKKYYLKNKMPLIENMPNGIQSCWKKGYFLEEKKNKY